MICKFNFDIELFNSLNKASIVVLNVGYKMKLVCGQFEHIFRLALLVLTTHLIVFCPIVSVLMESKEDLLLLTGMISWIWKNVFI